MTLDLRERKWSDALSSAASAAPRSVPDLSWAERIVEKKLRGHHVNFLPLKMASEALKNAHRLQAVEAEIRDRIAAERGALTTPYRSQ